MVSTATAAIRLPLPLLDGQQFTLTINIFSRQIVVASSGGVTSADVAIYTISGTSNKHMLTLG